jgi:MinD-like ATPase involved in chromosome partitioning or flagellar assembly
LSSGKTIAFHSYKGGTGKTTVLTNLAACLAMMGKRICLLDFDLYAPCLTTYFQKNPGTYLNSFLAGEVEISDVLIDLTSELELNGKLFLGFSSPKKEDIHEIEIRHDMKWQYEALRRLIAAKKELFSKHKIDFLLIDTSPGIRYWAINALATADILFLLMKLNEMDIVGTKKMIEEIYNSLTKFGSKYFLILNKVPGASPVHDFQNTNKQVISEIEKRIGVRILEAIPCFCEIQFNKHEFLTAIKEPSHIFSERVQSIADKINEMSYTVHGE